MADAETGQTYDQKLLAKARPEGWRRHAVWRQQAGLDISSC
ncbi:hypothetical protein [Rhodococcus sp. (in: high G+C Gram-positive bacteria)]